MTIGGVTFAVRGLCVLLIAFAVAPAYATVKVGNGGDVIDSFLDQMRRSLVVVVANPRPDKSVWEQCYEMDWLNLEQQALCAAFTRAALVPIAQLNTGPNATPLKHVQQPIETLDPDGQLRRVAAGTECGPVGPILFHYDTVRTYSPRQLFHLLSHEFGHKVEFLDRPCVTDIEPIGAFDEPGGGRKLMDAFAEALTMEAVERNEVGEIFALQDSFACGWTNQATGDGFESTVVAQRVVFDKGVFDRFETGVSLLPRDSFCEFKNGREPGVKYLPRLKISENSGCRQSKDTSVRRSELSVLKVFDPLPDGSTPPAEEILSQVFEGVNPICEDNPRDFVAPLSTSYGSYFFTLRYIGTRALGDERLMRELLRSVRFFLED
jgi:hypothetical protein